jgi:hypothetical protein
MKKIDRLVPAALLALVLLAFAASAQSLTNGAETTVIETAYNVVQSYGGKLKVNVAVVAENPFGDKFASRPTVRVTLRAADGSVITTREVSSAGIPPKQRIAFCESLYADEMPAKVEFRPLDAGYEATAFRPSEFLPFELVGVRARDDGGRLRVTGEIKNPYPGETGAWITLLFRDAKGKLLGGHTKYESTVTAGDLTPFEFYVDADEIPPETKAVDRVVFNHNNYQRSWQKLLRR